MIILRHLILYASCIKSSMAAFGLSVASTLLYLVVCIELGERKVGFLGNETFDHLDFYVTVGVLQLGSAFSACLLHILGTQLAADRMSGKDGSVQTEEAVGKVE